MVINNVRTKYFVQSWKMNWCEWIPYRDKENKPILKQEKNGDRE
jgi:hypothetical protein